MLVVLSIVTAVIATLAWVQVNRSEHSKAERAFLATFTPEVELFSQFFANVERSLRATADAINSHGVGVVSLASFRMVRSVPRAHLVVEPRNARACGALLPIVLGARWRLWLSVAAHAPV